MDELVILYCEMCGAQFPALNFQETLCLDCKQKEDEFYKEQYEGENNGTR